MFSIKESLRFGWDKFKSNLNLSLATTLLVLAVSVLGEIGGEGKSGFFIFVLASVVLSIIIRVGYIKIFLKMADGEDAKFSEIFEGYKMFWRYLGVSILVGLAVIGGLILLVIPGLIWAIKYSFSQIILVDTEGRPVSSMKESGAITQGSKWKLLGFYIVLGLINILGVVALGVGLLVSIPVSTFAIIHVYRKLSKERAGLSAHQKTDLTPIGEGV